MNRKLFRGSLIVVTILMLAAFQPAHISSESLLSAQTSIPKNSPQPDDPIFWAVVVVRAVSGASYMDDREYIATMPELKTIEEMQDFVARYEPAPEDAQSVRLYFENQGCSTLAQDNLLLIVSGTHACFADVLRSPQSLASSFTTANRDAELQVFRTADFQPTAELERVDGLLVMPLVVNKDSANAPALQRSQHAATVTQATCTPPDCYTIDDLADLLLGARYVHESMGLTGQGVRIGFIDEGVLQSHSFFAGTPIEVPFASKSHPLNAKYYALNDQGQYVRVGDNYDPKIHGFHGTMIAAFLTTFAPDANLLSFARPTQDTSEHDWILTALTYMSQYHLVDIVSMSQSTREESIIQFGQWAYIDLVRTQIINLITKKSIILFSGGNAGSCDRWDHCSGSSAYASIPEVIAVGGANTDFSAAGGYSMSYLYESEDESGNIQQKEGVITGAASYESQLHSGRYVPDIVGIFGPQIRIPGVSRNEYGEQSCGTSGATPQMAGIVALLKQQDPSLNQTQVRAILQNNTVDITTGQSGSGDPAGPGYDRATGYGLPLAPHVVQNRVALYKGWNLVGLMNEHTTPYMATEMLNEINTQGNTCDNITYWRADAQRYEGIIVDDGQVYGSDFPLELGVGYWVRCSSRRFWSPSGDITTTSQTLELRQGWNLISIPYSDQPVTTSDMHFGTVGACRRTVSYNGIVEETLSNSPYFTMSPGRGYAVFCDRAITWTPTGTEAPQPYSILPVSPGNIYNADSGITSFSLNALTAQAHLEMPGISAQQCVPSNVILSNITGQQFSVSWTTPVPCMGSVVIHNGSNPTFQAFDDRGIRFDGTTHHVTIRGLFPETIYAFGILSGDVWDNNAGSYYTVQTGPTLSLPTHQYQIHGQVTGQNSSTATDSLAYVQLENHTIMPTESSTLLSFPIGEYTDGYRIVLNNARTADKMAHFNCSNTSHLRLEIQGGTAGRSVLVLPANLNVTPIITAATVTLANTIPNKPDVIAPNAAGLVSLRPTFSFTTTDNGGNRVIYRLELSTDNFASVERIYDQRDSVVGWSAANYASGAVASFTMPDQLENLRAYQWRILARNSVAWSNASDISTFAIARTTSVYLPLVLRNFAGVVMPGPTATPQPTATPLPTPTATPIIPPPISAPVTSAQIRVKFFGRSSTLVGSVGHSILVRVVIRDPQNGQVLYSAIDLPTVSGTTAETDYGTLTLGSLGGYNIYVGREYELLITGKMHLTRKWTIVFPSTQSVLNFTSDNDLLWYGDLNDDNRVDDTDYDIWVEQYLIVRRGGTITPEMYYKVDSDGNGTLNMDDYSNIVIAYLRGPGVGDY